ncbi:cation-translocating P-type ATPase [Nocardioides sp. ChNu-153]|uniref:HAD family hydrolase n=1 Tax=unclassified Nocardioides TaxID=2615069 RepID=UPI0024067287|nr:MULTISPECIES: HAD family hydrolase [unclassified Nocardioides]MDF9716285.1 HAD family hydrolase [Nocardioides sp. ChNu-99]MDN7122753.1 cation-translocating P-type ATPase [Nocardioides sp. ChNu-153]
MLLLAAVLLVLLAETIALAPLRADGVVLPRGGALLAVARRVDALVADVSGFVTDGELQVVAVEPVEPDHDRNLRWFAGALQHQGEGPVARAIARLSSSGRVTDVRRVPGAGIEGAVDRHPVRVGDPRWIGVTAPPVATGGHTVAVEVDGRTLGCITVAERVRPEAAGALVRLADAGLTTRLVSAAGDLEAKRIASETSGEVTPADDADGWRAVVTDLRATGRTVACVAGPGTWGAAPGEAALWLSTGEGARPPTAGGPVVRLPDLAVQRVERFLAALRALPGRVRALRVAGLALAVVGLLLAGAGVLV